MKPLRIAASVIDEARRFFEERGASGLEGTAMIAHHEKTDATRLVIPDQLANRAAWVEVTDKGKLDLAESLALAERYVARIHSHPCEAFHSTTDDENPALTHEGALSIVAPYFGLGLRRGFDAAAVYLLRAGQWLELPPGSERQRWIVVS